MSDGAKIMYGKIARLSSLYGDCRSSNSFLDSTKSGRNASRFIAELKDSGYIVIENERSRFRRIRICPVESKLCTADYGEADGREVPYIANSGEVEAPGNACIANSGGVENPEKEAGIANSGEVEASGNACIAKFGGVENPEKEANPANLGGVDGRESPYTADSGGVQAPENAYTAKFGDRTSSSSYINKTTTTPGLRESFSQEELKEALSTLDSRLSFDKKFYPRAAVFMSENGLDFRYLSWLHEMCEGMNYRSFDGLFFSLFFLDNILKKFKLSLTENMPQASWPPKPPLICPACGEAHAGDGDCPYCGLPENPPPEQILLYRELHEFPPEKRREYLEREESLYAQFAFNDPVKCKSLIRDMQKEYGLTAGA